MIITNELNDQLKDAFTYTLTNEEISSLANIFVKFCNRNTYADDEKAMLIWKLVATGNQKNIGLFHGATSSCGQTVSLALCAVLARKDERAKRDTRVSKALKILQSL